MVLPLFTYPSAVSHALTFDPDVEPWATVCEFVYQLLVFGVVHFALAAATWVPAAQVIVQSVYESWSVFVVVLGVAYPDTQLALFDPDVDPADTVCCDEYQLPDGVEHVLSAVATTVPAEHVILQSFLLSWLLAAVPVIVYPDGHESHDAAPVFCAYVLPLHTLHDVAVLLLFG